MRRRPAHLWNPAVGRTGFQVSVQHLFRNCPHHISVDHGGGNDIGGDAPGGQFFGKGLGKSDDCRFGGRVVGLPEIAVGRRGGDVDDFAVVLLSHERDHVFAAVVEAVEVDVNDLIPLIAGHFVEQRVSDDSGVVDQNVNTAKSGQRFFYGYFNLIIFGNIAFADQNVAAQLLAVPVASSSS